MFASIRQHKWYYELGILAAILMWGVNFVVCKQALQLCNAWVFNGWRISLSVSFLGLVLASHGAQFKADWHSLKKTPFLIALLGLSGHFIYQWGFIQAMQRTTAGNMSLIIASAPIWTAIFAFIGKQEKLPLKAWISLFISVLGTIIVVLGGGKAIHLNSETFVGNLYALIPAVAWGLYTVTSKPQLKRFSATGLTFWTMLCALPFIWVQAVPHLSQFAWQPFQDIRIWLPMLFSGLCSTGIAYILWNHAVHHVGASQTAVSANLVPIVAIVVAYFYLGEKLWLVQLFGGLLTLSGILLMRKK